MEPISNYLALGDSYTIGEGVPLYQSFPYQTAALLRRKGFTLIPEIIAQTGWTSQELIDQLRIVPLLPQYDFVSLLIGVNNQYRGQSVKSYQNDFTNLLRQGLVFTNGDPLRVMVLSIPDWGATPFAAGMDRLKISMEIDCFNEANASIAAAHKVAYLHITNEARANADDPRFLASDSLHPSGMEYALWAEKMARAMTSRFSGL